MGAPWPDLMPPAGSWRRGIAYKMSNAALSNFPAANMTNEMLGVKTWLNETCGIPLEVWLRGWHNLHDC